MKAKSSAKGDASIPRGNRFAFSVNFDAGLSQESKEVPTDEVLLYFDGRQKLGQMVSQLCQKYLLTACTDFNNVQNGQLNIYAMNTQMRYEKL